MAQSRFPSWKRNKTLFIFGVIALLASLVTSCSSGQANTYTGSPSPPDGRVETVTPNLSTAVPASSHIVVHALGAPASANASITPTIATPVGNLPDPVQLLATPRLLVATGSFPAQGVNLTFRVRVPPTKGSTPFLATFDPSTNIWTPVDSVFDPAAGTVSAHVTHFSIWSVLRFLTSAVKAIVSVVVKSVVGTVHFGGPTPSCTETSEISISARPNDGELNQCVQAAGASGALVKISGTLGAPMDVLALTSSTVSLDPTDDAISRIVDDLNKAANGQSNRYLVPAGSLASASLQLGPGSSATMKTELDTIAYLASIIDSGIQALTIIESKVGGAAKPTLDALEKGKCLADITYVASAEPQLNPSEVKTLAADALACANTVVDLGAVGVAQSIAILIASLFEDVVQTAYLGLETVISTGGQHVITVVRSAAPNFSAFVGTWGHHGAGLTVNSDGTFALSFRTYEPCPQDPQFDPTIPTTPGVPCEDPFVSDAGQASGSLASVQGDTATGSLTMTNDVPDQPTGTVTLQLYPKYDEIIETDPSGSTTAFCGPNSPDLPPSEEFSCGA
jgi:hypothetical protein